MYRFAMGGELLWGQCFAAGVAEERQMSKIKREGFLLMLCGCVSSEDSVLPRSPAFHLLSAKPSLEMVLRVLDSEPRARPSVPRFVQASASSERALHSDLRWDLLLHT